MNSSHGPTPSKAVVERGNERHTCTFGELLAPPVPDSQRDLQGGGGGTRLGIAERGGLGHEATRTLRTDEHHFADMSLRIVVQHCTSRILHWCAWCILASAVERSTSVLGANRLQG